MQCDLKPDISWLWPTFNHTRIALHYQYEKAISQIKSYEGNHCWNKNKLGMSTICNRNIIKVMKAKPVTETIKKMLRKAHLISLHALPLHYGHHCGQLLPILNIFVILTFTYTKNSPKREYQHKIYIIASENKLISPD